MLKVNRRGGFSDRQGIKKQNMEIQLSNFDNRTRIQIFNLISELYGMVYEGKHYSSDLVQEFYRYIWSDVFCQMVDVRKIIDDDLFFSEIKNVILNASYDDVLTMVEAIAIYLNQVILEQSNIGYYSWRNPVPASVCCESFNELFKKEYVGYRFVDDMISPISDENEIESISEALENPYTAVSEHISKAHNHLADRENPDYENSIKESISAVEAICENITGLRGKEATLGKMLKKLEDQGVEIHNALKSAFNTLYGYTSDAKGIRHAGDIGGSTSTFEEAKFMLVSCCAFINYLKGVMAD